MELWCEWMRVVSMLRPACARTRTFLWMVLALVGFSTRSELAGVTSFVRSAWIEEGGYDRLRHLFHSSGLHLDALTRCCSSPMPTTPRAR